MKYNNVVFCIVDFETTGLNPQKDYPIEVACLFTDLNLDGIKIYNSLIKYNDHELFNVDSWKEEYLDAYKVHKITKDEVINKGKLCSTVVQNINDICLDIRNEYKINKIIMISDNAFFDFAFMKRLYSLSNQEKTFPFHYSAWDTNLLLEYVTDVGDSNPVHRALLDVLKLYKQLVIAITKVK